MSFHQKRRELTSYIANYLDMPKDLVLDLPKVIVVGKVQVFVENHRGILAYDANHVRLHSTLGVIFIEGEKLVLRNIFPEEIIVEGLIKKVCFEE